MSTRSLFALPSQVNYLVDEAVNSGKGANNISMPHHFLEAHNLGEASLHFYTDNCSGQNKSRFVMQYLSWRVIVGLNKITLSFTRLVFWAV